MSKIFDKMRSLPLKLNNTGISSVIYFDLNNEGPHQTHVRLNVKVNKGALIG